MSKSTVKSNSGPFRKSYTTKMRYATDIRLDGAVAGLPVNYMFNAIDMRDPDRTGVGHQPLGFNQLEAIYEHYTVLKAKITATFIPLEATGYGVPIVCNIMSNNGTVIYTTPDSQREQGQSTSGIAGFNGSRPLTLIHNFDSKRFFGVTDVDDNHHLSGRGGASPTENACLQISVAPADAGQISTACVVQILIEYTAKWTERKPLALST